MTRGYALAIRGGIALMVVDHLNNGLWALFAASNYYRSLPGTSDQQPLDPVSAIVRDLGIARLTLAVLLIAAAVLLERRILLVALGVASFAGVLRLAAHVAADDSAEWFNWIGYGLGAAIPLGLIALVWRST